METFSAVVSAAVLEALDVLILRANTCMLQTRVIKESVRYVNARALT